MITEAASTPMTDIIGVDWFNEEKSIQGTLNYFLQCMATRVMDLGEESEKQKARAYYIMKELQTLEYKRNDLLVEEQNAKGREDRKREIEVRVWTNHVESAIMCIAKHVQNEALQVSLEVKNRLGQGFAEMVAQFQDYGKEREKAVNDDLWFLHNKGLQQEHEYNTMREKQALQERQINELAKRLEEATRIKVEIKKASEEVLGGGKINVDVLEKLLPQLKSAKNPETERKTYEQKQLNRETFFTQIKERKLTEGSAKITQSVPLLSEFDSYEKFRNRMRGWRCMNAKVIEWDLIWYVCECFRSSCANKEVSRILQKKLEDVLDNGECGVTLDVFLNCLDARWKLNEAQQVQILEEKWQKFEDSRPEKEYPSETWDEIEKLIEKLTAFRRDKTWEERVMKFPKCKKIKDNAMIASVIYNPAVTYAKDVDYVFESLKTMEIAQKLTTVTECLGRDGIAEPNRNWN